MYLIKLRHQPPLHLGELAQYPEINQALLLGFQREQDGPASRQSHFESGRYENTYIERAELPEVEPLCRALLVAARTILNRDDLKMGFWFNQMAPGQRTVRHDHQEDDELLSCVYYLKTPDDCGDLLVYHRDGIARVSPVAGHAVFFSPRLAHEVEPNRSAQTRLSIAFNFGPANE